MHLEADLGFGAGTFHQARDAAVVKGARRSDTNTNGDLASRFSALSARVSSPSNGWVALSPPLARLTWRVAVSNSTSLHCRPQSFDTRSPCRKAIRIMVASRTPCLLSRAALISFIAAHCVMIVRDFTA